MQTDDLIRSFADELAPIPPRQAQRRVALGIGAGAVLTLASILVMLGLRPDLGTAMLGFTFWMKCFYTASIAAGAIAATIQLARPETSRLTGLWLLAVPVALLAALAGLELARTPVAGWSALLAGQSQTWCTILVLSLSLPVFGGMVWAFRRLAPGNVPLAGAMAGLASGGCAATLYGLHCPEAAALFVLVWYTLGIALAGVVGMLAAPRLLRW